MARLMRGLALLAALASPALAQTGGTAVGGAVGSGVGTTVGNGLGGGLGGVVGGAVGGAVGSAVGNAVGGAVGGAVNGAVGNAVGGATGAAGNALGSGTTGVVGSALGSGAGNAVGGIANNLPSIPGIGSIGSLLSVPIGPPVVYGYCYQSAFGGGNCASESTLVQIGNLTSNSWAILRESMQIQNQLKAILDTRVDPRLQRMLDTVDPSQWNDVASAIARLQQLNGQAQGLVYQAQKTAEEADKYYPQYADVKAARYFEEYKDIAKNTRDQIIKALKNSDFAVDDFASLNGTLARLQQLNASPAGQTQAMQIGNSIALVLADQMSRMRVALKAQMDAHTAFMAHQINLEQRKVKTQEQFWRADTQKLRQGQGFKP